VLVVLIEGYTMKITKQQLKEIIKEEFESVLDERSKDPDGSGGSGFSGDARNRTPAQKKAHQAKVRAMRAKEPKSDVQKALEWLKNNPEAEKQADDYARMNAEDHESNQQLYAEKALELYNKRKRVTEEQDMEREILISGYGILTVGQARDKLAEKIIAAAEDAKKDPPVFSHLNDGVIQAIHQALKNEGEIK